MSNFFGLYKDANDVYMDIKDLSPDYHVVIAAKELVPEERRYGDEGAFYIYALFEKGRVLYQINRSGMSSAALLKTSLYEIAADDFDNISDPEYFEHFSIARSIAKSVQEYLKLRRVRPIPFNPKEPLFTDFDL